MEPDTTLLGKFIDAAERPVAEAVVGAVIAGLLVWWRNTVLGWIGRWTPQGKKLRRLQSEHKTMRQRLSEMEDIEARDRVLGEQIAAAERSGNAVLAEYRAIEKELEAFRQLMNASGASLYVAVHDVSESGFGEGKPLGLAFLCILPMNAATSALKSDLIPLNSIAGYCLRTGESQLMRRGSGDAHHYRAADKQSGVKTEDMVTFPVLLEGRPAAVLQLLNRRDAQGFLPEHVDLAAEQSRKLQELVRDFIIDSGKLRAMGVEQRPLGSASVIYADLSNSSSLFRGQSATLHALKLINRFFDAICAAAIAQGATIDNYIGDGVVIRLNQPQPVPAHRRRAVEAALAMVDAFERFKRDAGFHEFRGTYLRCGVASGATLLGPVGHPQNQIWRLMGPPISVAANICNAAPRGENIVLVDDSIFRAVEPLETGFTFERIDAKALSAKVRLLSDAVYRVTRAG